MTTLFNKECSQCGQGKPLTAFYKHPTGADGFTKTCKDCKRAYSTDRRLILKSSAPEMIREYHNRYVSKFPNKRSAHVAVGNAVRDGRLMKACCEVCGNSRVHGHHDDYAKPYEVRWLCAIHHKEWHSDHGEGRNPA